jgi:nucleotide-binding universal stress UspA family protein
MKKKILLPTDFSRSSWNTLRYAHELYKNEDVDFYILNAFMVQNYSMDHMLLPEPGETYFEEAKNLSERELQKLLKRIQLLDVPNNHNYYTDAVYNMPLNAVKDFVEAKDIDLVMVSNKGETDAMNVIVGSTSIDFMENIRNCPVFMIPSEVSYSAPNEIVFPTSFKTHYKRKELIHLCELARITAAPIRILHVSKELELSKEQLEKKALLEECLDGISYTFHFLENVNVQKGLNLFAQSRNSGMIAFINKKHTFFDSLFSKPMVQDLGYNTKVPVLTLHDLRN